MFRRALIPLLAICAMLAACSGPVQRGPLVLAAASMQEALTDAADAWAAAGHPRPVLAFAASSALARQVESGAPADLFVSADEAWMDDLAGKGLLRAGTRADLAGNALVLVVPADSAGSAPALTPAGWQAALAGKRLALADPDAVPAGRYAKAALAKLGLWEGAASRLVPAENVRAALQLVESGEVAFGIVYATDARASAKVRVVATFPPASHPPIRYPLAILAASANPDAAPFRAFLLSPAGQHILAARGFTPAG